MSTEIINKPKSKAGRPRLTKEQQEIKNQQKKEYMKEYMKNYYSENKEKFLGKYVHVKEKKEVTGVQKSYKNTPPSEETRRKYLEKVTCECGIICSRVNLYKHVRTERHHVLLKLKILEAQQTLQFSEEQDEGFLSDYSAEETVSNASF